MKLNRSLILTSLALSSIALADDGAMSFGGSPRLLTTHPSVRMARERVVVTVKPQGYHVDALFVFKNDGPGCKVRMGFPDQGVGADETSFDEMNAEAKAHGRKPTPFVGLEHFKSWVDGRETATQLVADDGAKSWHVKTVDFPAHGTRQVRVVYDAEGGGITEGGPGVEQASYVMHTGASWKGTIGLAELVVRFPQGAKPKPVSLKSLHAKDPRDLKDWGTRPQSTVVWSGFAPPKVVGNELRFTRRNLEPTKASDVLATYRPSLAKKP